MKTTVAALGSAVALCLGLVACGGGGDGTADSISLPVSSGSSMKGGVLIDPLAKNSADEAFQLTASVVDTSRNQARPDSVDLKRLASRDPRNGTYAVFTVNRVPLKLALDFNSETFQLWLGTGLAASGTFSPDPAQAGTYVFDNTTPTNMARFRTVADTVVGSFPSFQADVDHKRVTPFIATRALVSAQADLDGTYNRLTFAAYPFSYTTSSYLHQVRISDNGTRLSACASDRQLYRIENCPASFLKTYTVSAGSALSAWRLENIADPADRREFSIARIRGQKVYLSSGSAFEVGLPETDNWPAGTVHGGFTATQSTQTHPPYIGSAWVSAGVQADKVRYSNIGEAGNWVTTQLPALASPGWPRAIRKIGSAATEYVYAIQGAGLYAVVNVPTNAPTPYENGLFGLALTGDEPIADPRNGRYAVFAANGSKNALKLDFEARRYEMVEASGHSATGSFSPDAAAPGVYIFSTDRIAGPTSPARFQVTIDSVVGAFPFAMPSNGSAYSVAPFIAARNMVSDATRLQSGPYNRFRITRRSDGAVDSQTKTLGFGNTLTPGLALLTVCNDEYLDLCIVEKYYDVRRGSEPGSWVATNQKDPKDNDSFYVVRIGGRDVLLSVDTDGVSGSTTFGVALSGFQGWVYHLSPGVYPASMTSRLTVSTRGAYGPSTLLLNSYRTDFINPDGTSGVLDIALEPLRDPQTRRVGSNVRIATDVAIAANQYDAMFNGNIAVMVGRSSNPATQGYLQITALGIRLSDPP